MLGKMAVFFHFSSAAKYRIEDPGNEIIKLDLVPLDR